MWPISETARNRWNLFFSQSINCKNRASIFTFIIVLLCFIMFLMTLNMYDRCVLWDDVAMPEVAHEKRNQDCFVPSCRVCING